MASAAQRVSTVRRVTAAVLDFVTVFFGFGMLIAAVTGDAAGTGAGFALEGAPALVLFALIAAYFYIGRRHLGGTLWDRILGIGRPQPP